MSVVVAAASQAATVVAVSQVHLDRPASVMDSFSKVKNQIAGVIGLSLSIGFLVGLACIALIVPGILLAIRWSLAVPAKVLEDKSVGDAMSRSSQLTLPHNASMSMAFIGYTGDPKSRKSPNFLVPSTAQWMVTAVTSRIYLPLMMVPSAGGAAQYFLEIP